MFNCITYSISTEQKKDVNNQYNKKEKGLLISEWNKTNSFCGLQWFFILSYTYTHTYTHIYWNNLKSDSRPNRILWCVFTKAWTEGVNWLLQYFRLFLKHPKLWNSLDFILNKTPPFCFTDKRKRKSISAKTEKNWSFRFHIQLGEFIFYLFCLYIYV